MDGKYTTHDFLIAQKLLLSASTFVLRSTHREFAASAQFCAA
jgi:hypothetical protein